MKPDHSYVTCRQATAEIGRLLVKSKLGYKHAVIATRHVETMTAGESWESVASELTAYDWGPAVVDAIETACRVPNSLDIHGELRYNIE